ncbi:SigE family RNA polymerase sigma factor [Actinoplanes sp. NPDC026670]|jgi:RNA polymerase sigma-70 factor (sigma-E family)|uniref:SigE family RNA polymerase sigma factor n=1 Tax=Actinoplanes sp. NPDC026670 TaxID=3154700 RepID=UPI00341169CE
MKIRRRRHNDETFIDFVAQRSGRLVAHAELLCGNHEQARDIVQSVLVRAYQRWRHIEHDDPYGYVHRAVTNAVTDWWRTAHQRHEQPVGELPDQPATPENTVEDRRALLAALDRLTSRERTIVVLRYLDDCSERDTAEALGVSLGTVKSTCSRALRKLRVVLTDEAPPTGHGESGPITARWSH